MKHSRRHILLAGAGAALGLSQPAAAAADSYPSRPVRMVVGFPAGGPVDITARLVAQWLTNRLGQPFIVENRPGAGGNVGTESVVRAAADGYTLLVCGPVNTINATLYDKLPFDFSTDIAPVAGVVRVPLVMLVNASMADHTILEFIEDAKAHPGKINMASSGNGTPQHVAGELFKMMAGVDLTHVPYRGSAPALNDLLGGQVQVMFDAMPSALAHVRSGKLRALAVTTSSRSPVMPDVPTVAEVIAGYEASSWYGLGAPAHTPAEVIAALNAELNSALADATFRDRLAAMGGVELPGSSADFGRLIASETAKWRKVVRAASIKLD